MKIQSLNLCPSCFNRSTCILTKLKDQVWSCSEYDEVIDEDSFIVNKTAKKVSQPELVLA